MNNLLPKKIPLVVIFGRTGAGKSTLFNCLVEKRQALVSALPGTTRDSNLGEVRWRGHEFTLVDTGGIVDLKRLASRAESAGEIDFQVQNQALNYLNQADLVLFLLDNAFGVLPQDKELALFLKKNIKTEKIILTVNKVDSPKDRLKISEFYKLSFGEPVPVSAANGCGTGDLLDLIVKKLKSHNAQRITPNENAETEKSLCDIRGALRLCVIGKPNAGKSSLLNALLGYERVIVHPAPHTTREPQRAEIIYQNQPLIVIDTAGWSKKGAKTPGLEKYGIAKSLAALAKSDLALQVLDIKEPLTRQDANLTEKIIASGKSLIFIANKWDLILKKDAKKYTDYIYGKLPFARFAPILFVSAKTGEKVAKIFDLALKINEERKLKLSDDDLEKFLKRVVKAHRPAKGKGLRQPRIRQFTQIEIRPPKFEIKIGPKEELHFSYVRFMENRLRETYGFLGTPIYMQVAKNRTAHGMRKD